MNTFEANSFEVSVRWNRAGFVPLAISFIDGETGMAFALNMAFEASGLMRASDCCNDAMRLGRLFGWSEQAEREAGEFDRNKFYCRSCMEESPFEDQAFPNFSSDGLGSRTWLEDLCYRTTKLDALSSAIYADLILDRLLVVEELVRGAFIQGSIFDKDRREYTRQQFDHITEVASERLGVGVMTS